MNQDKRDEELRSRFAVVARPLQGEPIEVTSRVLSPGEAIGVPPRDDFALIRGQEKIIEANFKGFRGHAFSAAGRTFRGTVGEILALPLQPIPERAVFFAAMNAVLASLGTIQRTVHCRDEDPMRCGEKLAEDLAALSPSPKSVALIGYQPGMTKSLSNLFRRMDIQFQVTDMNPENIGKEMFGTTVRDGSENDTVIREAGLIFCTGSTMVNGSLWGILDGCKAGSTRVVFFGVTVQGPAALMGWETFCPFGRSPLDQSQVRIRTRNGRSS
jgi:uncharacterized protein (DUF4213/DUF364 family)